MLVNFVGRGMNNLHKILCLKFITFIVCVYIYITNQSPRVAKEKGRKMNLVQLVETGHLYPYILYNLFLCLIFLSARNCVGREAFPRSIHANFISL